MQARTCAAMAACAHCSVCACAARCCATALRSACSSALRVAFSPASSLRARRPGQRHTCTTHRLNVCQ